MSDLRIHTVDSVGERLTRGAPRWTVHMTDQDGNGSGYVFPKIMLEWRAAEYGLTDIDEILDIVLHEPWMPEQPDRDDAALRAGLVTSIRADAEPVTLFNAASTTDALTAHRLRIADIKQAHAHVGPPAKGRNPLDVIRVNHGITADGLRAKREFVDVQRWQMLHGGFPLPVRSSSLLEVPRA